MKVTEKILALLEERPMSHTELLAEIGCTKSTVSKYCHQLEAEGQIYRNTPAGRKWRLVEKTEGGTRTTEIAPGHHRVTFGDDWKAGKGLTLPIGVSESPLNKLF
jgi:biotin operon repressor